MAGEVRAAAEAIADDPERLEAVRNRRQLLHDLRRKYGETLGDVLAFAEEAGARLAELEQHDKRAAEIDGVPHRSAGRRRRCGPGGRHPAPVVCS